MSGLGEGLQKKKKKTESNETSQFITVTTLTPRFIGQCVPEGANVLVCNRHLVWVAVPLHFVWVCVFTVHLCVFVFVFITMCLCVC